MQEFWNERFSRPDYVYGIEPNEFYRNKLNDLEKGKILFPCEGEGRNAVYAAKQGWDVHAFDYSDEGKNKAIKLAKNNDVEIDYQRMGVEEFNSENEFDCIVVIFAHFTPEIRKEFFPKLARSLKLGGRVILECFNKKQLRNSSGGPQNIDMLYDIDMLENDFQDLEIEFISKEIVELNEGPFHQGKADVIRMIAKRV